MGMELPYGPESRPPKRSTEQIKHEQALAGQREKYDPGFHSDNLFDQNEGAGGEVLDPEPGGPSITPPKPTLHTWREKTPDLLRRSPVSHRFLHYLRTMISPRNG